MLASSPVRLGALDQATAAVDGVDDDPHARVAGEVVDRAAHGLRRDARPAGQLAERERMVREQVQHDEAGVGELRLIEAFAPALLDEASGDGEQPPRGPVLDRIRHAVPPRPAYDTQRA